RLAKQYPEHNARRGVVVVPMHEQIVGDIKPALLVLLGAVGFVLLIACANVANLLLARAAVRQKEIALRLALGANRSRLTRQFLVESILLALIGATVGLGLAMAGLNIIKRYIPDTVSQSTGISIDVDALLFTAGIAILTGVLFGLVPAFQASHCNVNDTLKESGRDAAAGARGHRIRNALVVAEVAVSFTLLIGAGLLINSFMHLRNLDPGFRADHLLTMRVPLSQVKYPDREKRTAFFDEVMRRVRALPGIESAAVGNNLPLTYDGDSILISVEGLPDPPSDQHPDVILRVAGPNYFTTMGIPLVAGRDFTAQDNPRGSMVVIVAEKTARYYWPGENAIGKRIRTGSESPWFEVVGVVKDVRQNDFVKEPKMEMYMAYAQVAEFPPNALVVRTRIDPLRIAPTVRQEIWAIDKDQPVSDIRSMDEIVSKAVARQRFSMLLLGIFAGVALVLAAVGIYGVMSYTVLQRTREIGIRMALGGQRTDMLKMTICHSLKLVLVGLTLGLAAAFVLTRVMNTLLFGISATDPVTYLSISFVLLVVAVLASYIPALRATKVDPMVALRYE
ncbi:MAG: ABC transporter permease, partial [Chthoniobacterales bacterium]